MTQALCLRCGESKFGALCPCHTCGDGPTGNVELDIAFSDHHMPVETIREFGQVIRAIRLVSDDEALNFWSFVAFVSASHPEILRVDLDPETERRTADVLTKASLPSVTLREPIHRRLRSEGGLTDDDI